MIPQLATDTVRRPAIDPLVEELLRHWPRLLSPPPVPVHRTDEELPAEARRLALSWSG